jgi:hypothetical protein
LHAHRADYLHVSKISEIALRNILAVHQEIEYAIAAMLEQMQYVIIQQLELYQQETRRLLNSSAIFISNDNSVTFIDSNTIITNTNNENCNVCAVCSNNQEASSSYDSQTLQSISQSTSVVCRQDHHHHHHFHECQHHHQNTHQVQIALDAFVDDMQQGMELFVSRLHDQLQCICNHHHDQQQSMNDD